MKYKLILAGGLAAVICSQLALAEVIRTEANNGNLVMEDIPPIPATVVKDLNRYQNVRSAGFQAWTAEGSSIFVSTRFGDVSQVHRVDHPGGARHQITFFKEPIGGVEPAAPRVAGDLHHGRRRQRVLPDLRCWIPPVPATRSCCRTVNRGTPPSSGTGSAKQIAYQSTRRNGASNDIWVMDVAQPGIGAYGARVTGRNVLGRNGFFARQCQAADRQLRRQRRLAGSAAGYRQRRIAAAGRQPR